MYNVDMGLNETPSADRVHIAFFGRRNAGKSSLVNAVTGQDLAIVSEIKGTTTDPVYKAMELLPLGPVVIIDTPGYDDDSDLGEMRISRTKRVLNKTDAAVLVLDASAPQDGFYKPEEELIKLLKEKNIPYVIALNKYDLTADKFGQAEQEKNNGKDFNTCVPISENALPVSAKTGFNINLLKEKIAVTAQAGESDKDLIADLIKPGDFIVLVIPIDKAAPKGRLILPQQRMIRCILDAGGIVIAARERELREALAGLAPKPALVITDSQVFAQVSSIVPEEIPLTSFSILFARFKGFLETAVKGAAALDALQDGDKILICEGCTHHRQCDDIGTVKIPRLVKNHSSKEPDFHFCSGGDFPQDLSSYKLIIHCGSCMLNEREVLHRKALAEEQNIPFTNYGIVIAHIQGILKRSIAMLNL